MIKIVRGGCYGTRPGEIQRATCHLCGAKMSIDRNVMGATCFAEAMRGGQHLHDWVHCPHAGDPWHNQINDLLAAIRETPSPRVRALLKADLADVRASRGLGRDVTVRERQRAPRNPRRTSRSPR